jgi:hypothetical protein
MMQLGGLRIDLQPAAGCQPALEESEKLSNPALAAVHAPLSERVAAFECEFQNAK